MGDAAEGLVDTDTRLQERMDEREMERVRRAAKATVVDPARLRERESLRLARAELERQSTATASQVRREQIALALAEIDRRLLNEE